MITFRVSHSYEEDYFYVEDIEIKISDEKEKERIKNAIKKHELIGQIGYPSEEDFALRLGVNKNLIDIDVDEIDMY